MTDSSPRGRPRKTGRVADRPPRDEILAAARRLFAEQGYTGTSTGAIAQAVGLTQPAIFYHFTSKEELFRELAVQALDEPLAALAAVRRAQASPGGRLYGLILFHVTHDLSSPFSIAPALEEAMQVSGRDSLAEVFERSERYSRGIRALVAAAVKAGQFRTTDPFTSAMAILGMCNWALRWYRQGGRLSPTDVATDFADFAVTALVADAATLPTLRAEGLALQEAISAAVTAPSAGRLAAG